MLMHRQLAACSLAGSKLQALVNDLTKLRAAEPHMHAVVFTQSVASHASICRRLCGIGITVYELSGKTTVKKRHNATREFQAARRRPTVFVITMKAGNCGITLTAATRVYLMEPCVDPALEVQAAGRIHRLGQEKQVMCKRLCSRGTYEEQIVTLHGRLKSGHSQLTDGKIPASIFRLLNQQ